MDTRSTLKATLCGAGLLIASAAASAAVVGYVANPASNSTNWSAAVTGMGATINTSIDFEAQAPGPLNNNLYSGQGVTLGSTGDSNTVALGAGPGQSNTFSSPLSSGEGLHAPSNFLFDGGSASTFSISFATPVVGVGLFIIDYFNPGGDNPLTIEAFDAGNNSLGVFSSAAFNFQQNNKYFMGVTSTAGDISRLVFTDVNSNEGDTTGIDDVMYARVDRNGVPEPASVALFGLGLLGAAAARRRAK